MTTLYYCKAQNRNLHEIGYQMLKKHLGYQPEIVVNEYGKPYLKDASCYFNLSHQGEWVVLAVSDYEVGVDVQRIQPIAQTILQRMFHDNEQERIQSFEDMTKVWCMKESYGKYQGTGIQLRYRTLDFSLGLTNPCFQFEKTWFTLAKIEHSIVAICANDDKINMIPIALEEL